MISCIVVFPAKVPILNECHYFKPFNHLLIEMQGTVGHQQYNETKRYFSVTVKSDNIIIFKRHTKYIDNNTALINWFSLCLP